MAVEHLTWSGPLVAIVSLRAGCLRGDGRLCESIPRPSLAPRCCYVGLGGAGQTWRFRERSSDPSPSSPTEPRHFLVHRRPDDGPAQVLKILEHVLNHSLVQRAEVRARMAKRVSTREVPEIPVDELPIETIVVTHEQCSAFRVFPYPTREVLHHAQRIVEAECIAPCEPADGESLGNPFVRNGPEPTIKGFF
jgi:hypothetical protein